MTRSSSLTQRFARVGGFTLLELLVVVAIIGLLAAYVGPKYFGQVGKSERALAKAQIDSFNKALAAYRLDLGTFPTTEEGLNALVVKPASASSKWTGPYLSKGVPMDPWGHAYVYRAPGSKSEYDLMSYGKDGQPGGTGEAADIGND
jgi:general secretion pathway protein G